LGFTVDGISTPSEGQRNLQFAPLHVNGGGNFGENGGRFVTIIGMFG